MQDIFASITEQLVSFRATEIAVIGGRGFLAMLVVSLAASLFISALYLIFYQNRATGSQINRAFPLLGIAITTLFVSIQFSLPLSLGLLGALSIVRFRTPIKEPEEIGFLMLVIASSIAIATANFKFMMILLAAAVAALLLLRYGPRVLKDTLTEGYLSVSFDNDRYAEAGDAVKPWSPASSATVGCTASRVPAMRRRSPIALTASIVASLQRSRQRSSLTRRSATTTSFSTVTPLCDN